MAEPRVVGIIVAAGSGQRLGADVPKAFVEVGGRPLLTWAVDAMRHGGVEHLVVVAPSGWEERAAAAAGPTATIVTGGATRTASVDAGLAAVPNGIEVVAVHDAARALTPPGVVAAAVRAVVDTLEHAAGSGQGGGIVAAAPGLAVADTLKRVGPGGTVAATVDRAHLVGIQTPQVFPRAVLALAHRVAADRGSGATDDLALVEDLLAAGRLAGRVVVTAGSALAFKVTTPDDLVIASSLALALAGHDDRTTGHEHREEDT